MSDVPKEGSACIVGASKIVAVVKEPSRPRIRRQVLFRKPASPPGTERCLTRRRTSVSCRFYPAEHPVRTESAIRSDQRVPSMRRCRPIHSVAASPSSDPKRNSGPCRRSDTAYTSPFPNAAYVATRPIRYCLGEPRKWDFSRRPPSENTRRTRSPRILSRPPRDRPSRAKGGHIFPGQRHR